MQITFLIFVNNRYMTNKKVSKKQVLFSILAGVMVGFVNGFLGAGGGMLVVPLLRLIFKQSPKVAHSTAVLVILPICLVSGVVYLLSGTVQISVLWPVAIGTFCGGLIGTFLLCKLKNNVITILFSVVMIGAGIFIIIKSLV